MNNYINFIFTKLLSAILLLTLLLCTFVACDNEVTEPKYEVYEAAFEADESLGINHTSYTPKDRVTEICGDAPSTRDFVFKGQTYSLTYKESEISSAYSEKIHYYTYSDALIDITVGVSQDYQKTVCFEVVRKTEWENDPDAQTETIANEYFEEHTADTTLYKPDNDLRWSENGAHIHVDDYFVTRNTNNCTEYFRYAYHVQGIRTANQVEIGVDSDGTVSKYSEKYIGAFKKYISLTNAQRDDVKACVLDKVNKLYGDCTNIKSYTVEVKDSYLTVEYTSDFTLVYVIEVKCITNDGETVVEKVKMFACLEYPYPS